MGKKYIIELLDKCNSKFKGIMLFGLTQEKQISVELIPEESMTPYTEPDMEQVRKEAYDKGYTDAAYNCHERCAFLDDEKQESYRCGLRDAWEAAKKIYLPIEYGGIPADVLRQMFDNKSAGGIFKKVSAPEAVKKVQQYMREQEKKQHVWVFSEANEPNVDTTLICSECGYAIKIKPHETPELNFCPKCGDCKKPKEEKS